MKRKALALALGMTLLLAGSAGAILIDPYDNVLAPDGYYGLGYFNYYHADELRSPDVPNGGRIDLNAWVGIARGLVYHHFGPVPVTFQLIVPFGKLEETKLLDESSSGLGDITFGPGVFLYANQTSNTYLSYWFYVTAPTGEWDPDQAINLSQHNWYFEHQLAFNQIYEGFVFDMNLNYYHHTEESDNDVTQPPRFELEASLAYQVTPALVLGLQGGGYWDLDQLQHDGDDVDNTKAKRLQFGPELGYQITERLGANLRWTHDMSVANDTKGNDFWARVSYAF
jgi:hypothetical protein